MRSTITLCRVVLMTCGAGGEWSMSTERAPASSWGSAGPDLSPSIVAQRGGACTTVRVTDCLRRPVKVAGKLAGVGIDMIGTKNRPVQA